MKKETNNADVFERLRNGQTIPSNDPQAYKMREASYITKKLLIQMNNASDPDRSQKSIEPNHRFGK